MNKILHYYSYALFLSNVCFASETSLKEIEAPSAIKNAVQNLLIIQNSTALHRVIKLDHAKFDKSGNLILKKDLPISLSKDMIDSEVRSIDRDKKHDYRVIGYFQGSDADIIFSYAMSSTLDSEFPEAKYGILSRNFDGLNLVVLEINKENLNKIMMKK